MIWDPDPEVVYKQIFEKEPGDVVIFDEALKVANKRQWWSTDARFLENLLNVARKRNLIIIFCLPRFIDLLETLRNQRILLWFDVLDRGVSVLKKRIDVQGVSDPWGLKTIEKLALEEGNRLAFATLSRRLAFERKNSRLICIVKFDVLPEDLLSAYRILAAKHDKAFLDEYFSKEEAKKKKEHYLIKLYKRVIGNSIRVLHDEYKLSFVAIQGKLKYDRKSVEYMYSGVEKMAGDVYEELRNE